MRRSPRAGSAAGGRSRRKECGLATLLRDEPLNILKIKKHYIDTGKVKFELRPFVLNAVDLNAFKLLHSVDEKDFLQLDKMLFKDQGKWFIIKSTNEESIKQSTEALKRYALLFGLSERYL